MYLDREKKVKMRAFIEARKCPFCGGDLKAVDGDSVVIWNVKREKYVKVCNACDFVMYTIDFEDQSAYEDDYIPFYQSRECAVSDGSFEAIGRRGGHYE